MPKRFDVAVVGATGVVGEALLEMLSTRKFPTRNVYALASERSVGKTLMCGNRPLDVENLAEFDFSKVQIALFSAGASISAAFVPTASAVGCGRIAHPAQFRSAASLPL